MLSERNLNFRKNKVEDETNFYGSDINKNNPAHLTQEHESKRCRSDSRASRISESAAFISHDFSPDNQDNIGMLPNGVQNQRHTSVILSAKTARSLTPVLVPHKPPDRSDTLASLNGEGTLNSARAESRKMSIFPSDVVIDIDSSVEKESTLDNQSNKNDSQTDASAKEEDNSNIKKTTDDKATTPDLASDAKKTISRHPTMTANDAKQEEVAKNDKQSAGGLNNDAEASDKPDHQVTSEQKNDEKLDLFNVPNQQISPGSDSDIETIEDLNALHVETPFESDKNSANPQETPRQAAPTNEVNFADDETKVTGNKSILKPSIPIKPPGKISRKTAKEDKKDKKVSENNPSKQSKYQKLRSILRSATKSSKNKETKHNALNEEDTTDSDRNDMTMSDNEKDNNKEDVDSNKDDNTNSADHESPVDQQSFVETPPHENKDDSKDATAKGGKEPISITTSSAPKNHKDLSNKNKKPLSLSLSANTKAKTPRTSRTQPANVSKPPEKRKPVEAWTDNSKISQTKKQNTPRTLKPSINTESKSIDENKVKGIHYDETQQASAEMPATVTDNKTNNGSSLPSKEARIKYIILCIYLRILIETSHNI